MRADHIVSVRYLWMGTWVVCDLGYKFEDRRDCHVLMR